MNQVLEKYRRIDSRPKSEIKAQEMWIQINKAWSQQARKEDNEIKRILNYVI